MPAQLSRQAPPPPPRAPHAPRPAQHAGADGSASSTALALFTGMANERGSFNCFGNSLVQCLWHVQPLRDALLALDERRLEVWCCLAVFSSHKCLVWGLCLWSMHACTSQAFNRQIRCPG